MSNLKFTNNATTTLANAISNVATSLTVAAGTGVKFPAITAPQFFHATLVKNGNPAIFEIVLVTAVSGDTFTIQRGLPAPDNTTPLSWAVGDFFNLFLTAGEMGEFMQPEDVQANSGNYAADAGTANAYSVTLNPGLTAHVVGMPIRFRAANTNTGASTFNDGAGALALVMPEGAAALVAGDIAANGIYIVAYDGARFQLISSHRTNFSQLGGSISPTQVPSGAVTQYQGLFSIAGGQITSPVAAATNATQLGGESPATAGTPGTIAARDSGGGLTAASFNVSSDARLKTEIEPIEDALEALCRLRGVRFRWRHDGTRSAGVIAQDAFGATPELVSVDENGFLIVNYDGYIGYLIEAWKAERQARLSLETRIADIEARLSGAPR